MMIQRFYALLLIIFSSIQFVWCSSEEDSFPQKFAQELLQSIELNVSLCAMPRLGDGKLAIALQRQGVQRIVGMTQKIEDFNLAQSLFSSTGEFGRSLWVLHGAPESLPLADWTADLLIIHDATPDILSTINPNDICHWLSPYRGKAIVGNLHVKLSADILSHWAETFKGDVRLRTISGNLWMELTPGSPKNMDEWSHFIHDSGNNPASKDTVIRSPFQLQFITPSFSSAGGSSRISGGRFFEIQGQQTKTQRARNFVGTLWCRNAYNGAIIWQCELPKTVDSKQCSVIATPEKLYIFDGDKAAIKILNAETGEQMQRLQLGEPGEQCKWMGMDGDQLYVLIGSLAPEWYEGASYHLPKTKSYLDDIRSQKLNHGNRIVALNVIQGETLWKKEFNPRRIDPRLIAAWDGKIACLLEDKNYTSLDPKGSEELANGHDLICLDGRSGALLWDNADPILQTLKRDYQFIFGREYVPGLIATSIGLRLRLTSIHYNDILVLDPNTGALRWQLDQKDRKSPSYSPNGYAGFFSGNSYFHGHQFDSLTGSRKALEDGLGWDGGCGIRSYAPNVGIIGNYSTDTIGMNLKSECHNGTIPAGGMLIAPRGWCSCSPVWRGSIGLSSRGDQKVHGSWPEDPERFTSSDAKPADVKADLFDWPCYRQNANRSGATPASLPSKMSLAWTWMPEHPYEFEKDASVFTMQRQDQATEPIAIGHTIYVGGSDGCLRAFNTITGDLIWTAWCSGQIYAAPTFAEGCIYVGSMDGYIHCFNSSTGELIWKFRVAPYDQRILVAEHLISRWPIAGGVLYDRGVIYAMAGINALGGVHLVALDANTGAIKWHNGEMGLSSASNCASNPGGFLTIGGNILYAKARGGLAERFQLSDGQRLPLPDYGLEQQQSWIGQQGIKDFGRELSYLSPGLMIGGGRSLQHEQNQHDADRSSEPAYVYFFNSKGDLNYRSRLAITPSNIPPSFDQQGMILVPGGWGRTVKVGKKVYQSPRESDTLGLMFLDTPALVKNLTEKAKTTTIGFKSKYKPMPEFEPFLNKKGTPDIVEQLEDSDTFKWSLKNRWIRIYATALAKNAVVAIQGYPILDSKNEPTENNDRWSVFACDRESGELLWEQNLPVEPIFNGLCIDREGNIIVSFRNGGLVCIKAE